uniref:Uncharacterized protein n=1 Tax=Arundo donax TaxID=35708 RepID=A0A0A9AVH1_ARUDO
MARETADAAKERIEEVKERVTGADAEGKEKHRREDVDAATGKHRTVDEL